jgi:hypothetical protein
MTILDLTPSRSLWSPPALPAGRAMGSLTPKRHLPSPLLLQGAAESPLTPRFGVPHPLSVPATEPVTPILLLPGPADQRRTIYVMTPRGRLSGYSIERCASPALTPISRVRTAPHSSTAKPSLTPIRRVPCSLFFGGFSWN